MIIIDSYWIDALVLSVSCGMAEQPVTRWQHGRRVRRPETRAITVSSL